MAAPVDRTEGVCPVRRTIACRGCFDQYHLFAILKTCDAPASYDLHPVDRLPRPIAGPTQHLFVQPAIDAVWCPNPFAGFAEIDSLGRQRMCTARLHGKIFAFELLAVVGTLLEDRSIVKLTAATSRKRQFGDALSDVHIDM